jgi:hypothetical protein
VGSALATYKAALGIATELGMRPLNAQCRLALGSLPGESDSEEPVHLEAALRMFREMDMQFWLEKAQAETIPRG